jgi:hypothetical protein
VQYIERCVPCLGDAARAELEDFALECARSLIDRNAQGFFTTLLQIWSEVGVDPAAMFRACTTSATRSCATRRAEAARAGAGFVLPTLKRCGLFSERVATHFHGFFRENFGDRVAGDERRDCSWSSSPSCRLTRRAG